MRTIPRRLGLLFLVAGAVLGLGSQSNWASPPEPKNHFQPDLPHITGFDLSLQQELTGRTPTGAYYKIVVPSTWNGRLVLWNHGFSLEEVGPVSDLGPLADYQLGQGYAVAASSYSQKGWALFSTVADLEGLLDVFVSEIGQPESLWIYGGSLGGAVTAQALEEADLGDVAGAFILCGAVAGSRNWDAALDLRLSYDVVAGDVPAGAIPGGAYGLPADSDFSQTDLAFALNATTGVFLPSILRSPAQQHNLDQILSLAQIPQSFLVTDLAYAVFGLADLTHDSEKLGGQLAIPNQGVVYGDPEIDTQIQRVWPNALTSQRLRDHFLPTGVIDATKIIQIHTDLDGLVIVENAGHYAGLIPPSLLTTAIVRESEPSHCGFSEAEVVAGWESLERWVETGEQPDVSTVQTTCQELMVNYDGPCRYDPDYLIKSLDDRIRPRSSWQAHLLPFLQVGQALIE